MAGEGEPGARTKCPLSIERNRRADSHIVCPIPGPSVRAAFCRNKPAPTATPGSCACRGLRWSRNSPSAGKPEEGEVKEKRIMLKLYQKSAGLSTNNIHNGARTIRPCLPGPEATCAGHFGRQGDMTEHDIVKLLRCQALLADNLSQNQFVRAVNLAKRRFYKCLAPMPE